MATGSISTLGVGSGLELQSILEQLKEVDQQVITRKESEVDALAVQLNEFTVVNNKLLTMKSSALNLSLSSSFLSRSSTSSSESVLTATVADGVTAQSPSVTVDRVAAKSTWMTGGNASDTTVINPTEENVTVAYTMDGKDVTVTVPPGTTLAGLADLLNEGTNNPGVTASIINDGSSPNPYKLVLKANATGSESEIDITTPWMDIAQHGATGEALNAKVTIDGVSYQRQSNTISDVLSGITMNLKGTGMSTVSVVNNDASVKEMIVGFVAAYNDAVQEIAKNTAYDEETKDFGILARTTMRDLPYALQDLMTSNVTADSEGLVTTLFDLGLEFDRDGSITIDETVLSAAISEAPDSVAAFFLGDDDQEITGMADKVNDYLRELTSGSGQVAAEKTAAQTRIDDLELRIEAETERLDRRYEVLTKQFVELDSYMSQMKSMGSYLTGQFDSLSSMLSGSSGK
ncbi:MAG: flagellar filament capping protein FliD [Desulfurivibrionaceae bacterium]